MQKDNLLAIPELKKSLSTKTQSIQDQGYSFTAQGTGLINNIEEEIKRFEKDLLGFPFGLYTQRINSITKRIQDLDNSENFQLEKTIEYS